jgi:uncharacterized protein (TIGR02453 family)
MFSGFSPQALKFLRDLKRNNERAWFQARKPLYEEHVLAPLQAMAADLSAALRKAKVPISADPKRVSFRIYRDVRFSHDKSPYKTNVGAYLPHNGDRDAPGGLYVHIEPKASFAAVGFYQLEKPMLHAWRESMAQEPKRFGRVITSLSGKGLEVSDVYEPLKRMPRGFEAQADSPLATYFRIASFITIEKLSDDDVMGKNLIERCVTLAKHSKALLDFGWSL